MIVNATLLVQVVHFYVAYVLLRYLLFEPFIAYIQQEDRERDQMRDVVTASELSLAEQQEVMKQQMRVCRQYVIENKPELVERKAIFEARPMLEIRHDVISEADELSMRKKLVERLSHVR